MRTRGLIDDNEYLEQKTLLLEELESGKSKLESLKLNPSKGAKETITLLNFIRKAQDKFNGGQLVERRELITMFGQKLDLLYKELTFTPVSWLIPIKENYSALERQFLALEPLNSSNLQIENKKRTSEKVLKSSWLRRLDSNQQPRS